MMRPPTLAAIHAAELRVAQSAQDTRQSLRRVRAAFRAALARPRTLALAAGAGGLLGFWLARRPRGVSATATDGDGVARTPSAGGVVLAFIVRYAMQQLPFILRQVWARPSALDQRTPASTEPFDAET